MARDLGAGGGQVHAQAQAVLDFWFGLPPAKHFAKDEALDAQIARRFGKLRDHVLATGAGSWRDDPDTLLAAIILLDQFSRNIHRDSGQAFAADPLAEQLTLSAVEQGWDQRLPPDRRVFLYMPLMHAEDLALQDRSVALFEALGIENNLTFAHAHRDAIARFGRFPGRNALLGRTSTSKEQRWLQENDGGW